MMLKYIKWSVRIKEISYNIKNDNLQGGFSGIAGIVPSIANQ